MAKLEQAVGAIKDLRTAGAVRILVNPSWRRTRVQFEVVEAHEDLELVLERRGLSREELKEAAPDVAEALAAAVAGIDAEAFAAQRAGSEAHPGVVDDSAADTLAMARDSFSDDLPKLKARLWVKTSAKNHVPSEFEWETATKHVDSETTPPNARPATFATLKISSTSLEPPFISGNPSRDVIMVVDEEDVAYMLDSLTRLKVAMQALSKETGT